MKNQLAILVTAGILGNSAFCTAEDNAITPHKAERVPSRPLTTKKAVQWTTDYQAALRQAKASNRAIFLFFTGSDWCSWCTKMEKEVLESREFTQTVGDQFIFVKVDLPRKTKLTRELSEQNQALAARFHISSFPSVVLIGPGEELIFESSGSPRLSSQRYAQDLLELARQKKQA